MKLLLVLLAMIFISACTTTQKGNDLFKKNKFERFDLNDK